MIRMTGINYHTLKSSESSDTAMILDDFHKTI